MITLYELRIIIDESKKSAKRGQNAESPFLEYEFYAESPFFTTKMYRMREVDMYQKQKAG